jgi:heptosyltransferase-2
MSAEARAARERDGVPHLLIRTPNWVGDLVMATPILAAALECEHWPRVTILVRAHLAAVLADGPWAGHVRAMDGARKELELYRRSVPDGALLLSNSFGAALRAFLSRVPARFGTALSGRRLFLTHAVVPPMRDGRRAPIPTAHLLRDVAALAGIRPRSLHPLLYVNAELAHEQRERLEHLGLESGGDYVLCTPGAAFGAAKLWPPESFAAVLDALFERHGWRGVVTGGPGEEALVEGVARAARHPVISLARERRDLARLKPLVRDARLLLVGDSGPRWYAAAFDVPCVTILGPNFPELTASSLELVRVVRREGLECSPCLHRRCPLGHHRCMRSIPPGQVLEAVEHVLARARPREVPAEALS